MVFILILNPSFIDTAFRVKHLMGVCWKVMVLNGEEGLEFEVHVEGIRLKHVSEFKYLVCFGKSGTDGAECSSKVANGRRVAGAIKSLVTARDLKLVCVSRA